MSKQLAQQLNETQEELEAYKLHDEGNKTKIKENSKKLEAASKKIKRREITIEMNYSISHYNPRTRSRDQSTECNH